MTDFGLQHEGFVPKTLRDVKAELEADLRATLGPEINLLPSSALGQLTGIFSAKLAELWDLSQAVYRSQYPDSADGEALDNVASITGVVRLPASKSRVTVVAQGTPGTFLSAGRLLRVSGTQRQFTTTHEATIGDDGTVTIEAEALEYGPLPALAGTLTDIATPVGGWSSVSNPEDAELGRLQETDAELRLRRHKLLRASGAGTLDSMVADLCEVDGVRAAHVFENVGDIVDELGLPPHAISAFVRGGDEVAIARAIWEGKPVGIACHGDIEQEVTDSTGRAQVVRFSRPTVVNMRVMVVVLVTDEWPVDGEERIKQLLARRNEQLVMGRDVVSSQLYGLVHSVPGVHGIERLLFLPDRNGEAPGYEHIVRIAPNEIALFDIDRTLITVEHATST